MNTSNSISDDMMNGNNFITTLEERQKRYIGSGTENISKFLSIFGVHSNLDGRKINITDVSLREGDQAPLTSFSKLEKIFVYLMLREIGVDTIEIGFPAGDADFENIKELIDFFKDDQTPPYISVLGRTIEHDTQRSIQSTSGLKNTRIHSFIATSEAHIIDKFCIKDNKQIRTLDEGKDFVISSVIQWIGELKKEQEKRNKVSYNMEIEFSPEDATNTKYDFLLLAIRSAIESGANIINIPDTVGITTPEIYKTMFFLLKEDTNDLKENGYNFRFSSHIHNDKGFASAGTFAAVEGGVSDVEVTQLGIGERTGNASLSDAIMTFGVDGKVNGNFELNGEKKIWLVWAVSEAVKSILSDDSSSRIPGIGKNAQTDGSGVHTANPKVYGGAKPYRESLGVLKAEEYFSARGGKNFLKKLLENIGISIENVTDDEFKHLLIRSAQQAEIQRRVYSSNILVSLLQSRNALSNIDFEMDSKNKTIHVSFHILGEEIKISENFSGENGYIEALIRGFKKILGDDVSVELIHYETKEKPSLGKIMNDFSYNVEKVISTSPGEIRKLSHYFTTKFKSLTEMIGNNNFGEESIALTHLKFNINGEERNIITQSRDSQRSIIEAITYSFISSLIKKHRS